ncbi:MAG: insulinase family protein [Chloroflexi bacterium]|nr:insulinase family protein [Chloroflexota bacterium]
MHQKTILNNGLRVVTSEMNQTRSVSLGIFLAAGSRHEHKESSGIAHFLEHMLFKGSHKRPSSREISLAIEGVGGVINGETGKELVVYWAKVAEPHWQLAFDVLADMVFHPLIDPAEVEKERKVVMEELHMAHDDPRDAVDLLLDEIMWGDHPLGWDVGGRPESLQGIGRDELRVYLQGHYVPAQVVVSAAGAIRHEEVVAQVDRLLGSWSGEPPGAWLPAEGSQQVPQARLEHRTTEQAHVCVGVPGLSYRDEDRFALDLLNVIFGEGMSSRLFLEIREKRGLAYDVHSFVSHFRDAGAAVVYAGVEVARIEPAIQALLEEIARLREPVSDEELHHAKEYWKGRILLRLEDSRAVLSWLGGQELLLDRILTVDETVAIIDALSVEDLQRAAARCFVPERLNLAVVGPYEDESRFAEMLRVV